MTKIIFHSNRQYNDLSIEYNPTPTKTEIPKWYSSADKYEKNPHGEYYLNPLGGKLHSFKSCPALLDIFTSGYVYVTPCDLIFYKDSNGIPVVKAPKGFEDFCGVRPKMEYFAVPKGFYENPLHWYPNWAPELPDGYSALYTTPLNRFDLPFINTAGIIDNDKMNTPGLVPFFLQKDFEGKISKGTPYLQIIPFKRENWEMEIKYYNHNEILNRHNAQADLYRTKDGGSYKQNTWSRKKYE